MPKICDDKLVGDCYVELFSFHGFLSLRESSVFPPCFVVDSRLTKLESEVCSSLEA